MISIYGVMNRYLCKHKVQEKNHEKKDRVKKKKGKLVNENPRK